MMSDWLASPDDSELEELDHFLRAHAGEEDMLLDGVHGFLTALAIGPAPAKPEEWLPEILHAPFADAEEGERVLTLLARLNDAITPELETGSYEPILGELDGEEGAPPVFTARGWCEGFSRGIDLRAPSWEGRLGHDSQLMELLSPIIALAIDDGVFESDGDFAPLGDDDYDECLAQIPVAVGAVAEYWRAHPLDEGDFARHGEAAPAPPRRRGGRWVH
ncbi:MAG: YecA family protein [Xanthomonadales bacterium]|nr:YecA family protein [Xanthomonadales bacterium]MDL1868208.1 YecA family protein [Gammaproteobacteria bacterium PRO6]